MDDTITVKVVKVLEMGEGYPRPTPYTRGAYIRVMEDEAAGTPETWEYFFEMYALETKEHIRANRIGVTVSANVPLQRKVVLIMKEHLSELNMHSIRLMPEKRISKHLHDA